MFISRDPGIEHVSASKKDCPRRLSAEMSSPFFRDVHMTVTQPILVCSRLGRPLSHPASLPKWLWRLPVSSRNPSCGHQIRTASGRRFFLCHLIWSQQTAYPPLFSSAAAVLSISGRPVYSRHANLSRQDSLFSLCQSSRRANLFPACQFFTGWRRADLPKRQRRLRSIPRVTAIQSIHGRRHVNMHMLARAPASPCNLTIERQMLLSVWSTPPNHSSSRRIYSRRHANMPIGRGAVRSIPGSERPGMGEGVCMEM